MKRRLKYIGTDTSQFTMFDSKKVVQVANWILLLTLFAVTSFLLILPFILNGKLYMGSDMQFHLNRIQELKNSLDNGQGFPYLTVSTFNGVGVPLNLLYSPITLYPFVLVFKIISNPITAVYVSIMIMIFFSLFLNFVVGWLFFNKDSKRAIIFTYVYSLSSITFGTWFSGFTLGQTVATIFFPIVLYGMYAIFWGSYNQWYLLAIGMAAILYSHLISVILITTMLLVLLVTAGVTGKHFLSRVKYLIYAVLSAIAFSAFFLSGFLVTELNSNLSTTRIFVLSESAFPIGNFLFGSLSNSYTIGVGIIFLIGIVLGIFKYKRLTPILKFTFWISTICVILSTSLFPWDLLQNTPVNVIQFPYRILSVSAVFMSILFTEIVTSSHLFKNNRSTAYSLIGIVLATCLLFSANLQSFIVDRNSEIELNYAPSAWHGAPNEQFYVKATDYSNLLGYNFGVGITDYWPKKSVKYVKDIVDHMTLINNQVVDLPVMYSISNGMHYEVNAKKDHSKIDLPFLDYHSYVVKVNGKKVGYSESKRGTILVKGNRGHNAIDIQYKIPTLVTVGAYLSVAAWVFLLLFISWRMITRKQDEV